MQSDEQNYGNDLRTVGDASGQTFEQRCNAFVKAFRALAAHPVLEAHTAELLGRALQVLLWDIQVIAGYPDGALSEDVPHRTVRYKLQLAFLRFMNHPETDEDLARFFLSAAQILLIPEEERLKICPGCGREKGSEGEQRG